MKNKATPVSPDRRIHLLDALRGFALLGILMVNMPLMYGPMTQVLGGADPNAGMSEIIGQSFIKFFFEGKFYVLFSFLFGYGFWIFMNKSMPEGASIVPVYRRRILILFLIGIAHMLLLWAGDILIIYALFGFLLILFRKSSDKKVRKWAIGFALLPVVINILMVGFIELFRMVPEARESIEAGLEQGKVEIYQLLEQASAVYSNGSFAEIIAIRWIEYKALLPGLLFFYPVVMAMFLTGILLARKQYLNNFMQHANMVKRIFFLSLIFGIVFNIPFIWIYWNFDLITPSIWSVVHTFLHILGGISLAITYATGFVLLYIKGKEFWLNRLFAPTGRMALSNYLMQSLITGVLFLPYGFNLFGRIDVWTGIGIVLLIFSSQIVLSHWWMQRFQYGPMEWLWRTLTYGKKVTS
ncbi:MAG: DUF418 domain-containing protein [Cyclobacteriaceae bacterium]|nr:DUF418 domain-containing protein [Cyclobacteriaceae bacterium]